jgi:FtsP/CotA-like multicopper oxidase with cupredoxin domain
MTGAFIIEGKYDDDLNLAYGGYTLAGGKQWNTRGQPILVLNQLGTTPNLLSGPGTGPAGVAGVDFVVNGRLRPSAHMQPGEIQLWRILNTSGRNALYFMAPTGFRWRQLAQDGVQLATDNYRSSENKPFYMAPGNRVDLLVQAPMTQTTLNIQIQAVRARSEIKPTPVNATPTDPAPGISLMSIAVAGDPVTRHGRAVQMPFLNRAPVQPKFLADITDQEWRNSNYATKMMTFDSKKSGAPMQHTINGIQFQNGRAHVNIALDSVEEWTIVNTTSNLNGPGPIDHPFHIHVNPFQVTEVFDPNEMLVDPETGQLATRLQNGKTVAVPRYVTDKSALTDPDNPFAKRQCFLDPKNEGTWSVAGACGPQNPRAERVWWDVFAIPSARVEGSVNIPGYFRMRSRFVDYPGFYVMHCHILVHEDRGMMFTVEVTRPKPTLVTHH